MPPLPLEDPDVLVLGVGGTLGEAWLTGILAGLEHSTGADYRDAEFIVGTSAGAWVGARLAAGRHPMDGRDGMPLDPEDAPPPPEEAGRASARLMREATRAGLTLAQPFVPVVLSAAAPAGRILRSTVLGRAPRPTGKLDDLHRSMARLNTRFDGRLRVVAVDRSRGRRVVFGSPGSPPASVADAVTASCSVPWVYAPIRINGREYVDGGVWSPTNLDVAPATRDTQVLCLTPTGHLGDVRRSALGVLRALGASATAVEAAALRQRGAKVIVVAPDAASAGAMGADFLDPGPRDAVRDAGWRQGLRLGSSR